VHIRKRDMHILASVNVHIRKRDFVYVHFDLCICTFKEAKMRIYGSSIYGRELPYIRILASVNAHI
jgi:hypothetical protein